MSPVQIAQQNVPSDQASYFPEILTNSCDHPVDQSFDFPWLLTDRLTDRKSLQSDFIFFLYFLTKFLWFLKFQ